MRCREPVSERNAQRPARRKIRCHHSQVVLRQRAGVGLRNSPAMVRHRRFCHCSCGQIPAVRRQAAGAGESRVGNLIRRPIGRQHGPDALQCWRADQPGIAQRAAAKPIPPHHHVAALRISENRAETRITLVCAWIKSPRKPEHLPRAGWVAYQDAVLPGNALHQARHRRRATANPGVIVDSRVRRVIRHEGIAKHHLWFKNIVRRDQRCAVVIPRQEIQFSSLRPHPRRLMPNGKHLRIRIVPSATGPLRAWAKLVKIRNPANVTRRLVAETDEENIGFTVARQRRPRRAMQMHARAGGDALSGAVAGKMPRVKIERVLLPNQLQTRRHPRHHLRHGKVCPPNPDASGFFRTLQPLPIQAGQRVALFRRAPQHLFDQQISVERRAWSQRPVRSWHQVPAKGRKSVRSTCRGRLRSSRRIAIHCFHIQGWRLVRCGRLHFSVARPPGHASSVRRQPRP